MYGSMESQLAYPNPPLPQPIFYSPPTSDNSTIRNLLRVAFWVGIVIMLMEVISYLVFLAFGYYGPVFCMDAFDYIVESAQVILVILAFSAAFLNNSICFLVFFISMAIYTFVFVINIIIHGDPEDERIKMVDNLARAILTYPWNDTIAQHNESPFYLIDSIQSQKGCCGLDGKSDWASSRPLGWPLDEYPPTCCSSPVDLHYMNETSGSHTVCIAPDVYSIGCRGKLDFLSYKLVGDILHSIFLLLFTMAGFFEYLYAKGDQQSAQTMGNAYIQTPDYYTLQGQTQPQTQLVAGSYQQPMPQLLTSTGHQVSQVYYPREALFGSSSPPMISPVQLPTQQQLQQYQPQTQYQPQMTTQKQQPQPNMMMQQPRPETSMRQQQRSQPKGLQLSEQQLPQSQPIPLKQTSQVASKQTKQEETQVEPRKMTKKSQLG